MDRVALWRHMLLTDARLVLRDRFLVGVTVIILLVSALLRVVIGPLEGALAAEGVALSDHYAWLSSSIAFAMGTSIAGMIIGFIMLEARETKTLHALMVSPLSIDGYVRYRALLVGVIGFVLLPLQAVIIGVGLIPLGPMLLIAVSSGLYGCLSALFVASFADNKVQAFAVLKILSAVGFVPIAVYFVDGPAQLFGGLVPAYWGLKAWWELAGGSDLWLLYWAVGVGYSLLLAWLLARRFRTVAAR